MAFDNTVTLVGNVTRDPELRYTKSGVAFATFSVAWNQKAPQGSEREDKAHFFDVTCWRSLAENVAQSVTRGTRVVVYGRLDQQRWEDDDGNKRSRLEVLADEVTPSLKWATAEVQKTASPSGGGGGRPVPNEAPPAYDMDEEPF